MNTQRWEYKVVFVEGWQRVSVEGVETHPEEHERNSAFGRRFLNGMGVDGWELTGIQHMMQGRSYLLFKRPLAAGAEPNMSVIRRADSQPQPSDQAGQDSSSAQAVSV